MKKIFRILNDRLRLIMKQSKIHLKSISDIVATCIILWNLCIAKKRGLKMTGLFKHRVKYIARMI